MERRTCLVCAERVPERIATLLDPCPGCECYRYSAGPYPTVAEWKEAAYARAALGVVATRPTEALERAAASEALDRLERSVEALEGEG